MKIGIDANPMVGRRAGVGWYTYNLVKALVELKEDGVEYLCYAKGSIPRDLLSFATGRPGDGGSGVTLGWVEAGRLGIRWRARADGLDLYHGTNFKLQAEGHSGGVLTIHDLWLDRHPKYSKKLFGQRLSCWRTRQTAWRARKVITVSRHSARDIQDLYGLPPERISVVPNGVSPEFYPDRDPAAWAALRRRLAIPAPQFLLFVGGADPRKNHRAVLQAYASRRGAFQDLSVVMVGAARHRFGDKWATARAFRLGDRLVCAEHCSLDELRLLYSHAEVFVFPSLYEGFGLPVLEAMACGVPIVASNTTSLPEVAGDAALLVAPEDPETLGEAIVRVIEDGALRETLRAKGFERAKQFTWERTARETLAVYREVCNESRNA